MPDLLERLKSALGDRYVVESEIGRGGMATVYLARDLKHERKVAVKVLKPELAAVLGAERFLSEIKVTANLQHPHILPLHDSGEADGFLFYVMPYVEGESLRAKLDREKQLSVEESAGIAASVANALDYAHRHDVIHRDIKPANILLHDGQPMVADFGIALAVKAAGGSRLTETGLSLGTPQYISPEQAAGDREVDGRADIYSLACVLYEMLVGEPPHTGPTVQAVIAKLLTDKPRPVTELRETVPVHVAAALDGALAKLPADRFSTAAGFGEVLTNPSFTLTRVHANGRPGSAARGPWRPVAIGMSAFAAILALLLVWMVTRPQPPKQVSRYSIALPEREALFQTPPSYADQLAITPDGRRLVYVGPGAQGSQLWVRQRNRLQATPLAGTDGAKNPFVSPDGSRIGFLEGTPNILKVVSIEGGPSTALADYGIDEGGGAWGRDGFLYVDGHYEGNGLARVPVTGGLPQPVTVLDSARGELWHFFPDALPNGRGVLFTASRGSAASSNVAVVDLASGSHEILAPGVRALYASSGHLIYVTVDGRLMVAPFDQESLSITGEAVAVADGLGVRAEGGVDIAVSETGTLVYATGRSASRRGRLVWVTREGIAEEIDLGWTEQFGSLALSPDARQLAVTVTQAQGTQVWIKPLEGGLQSRLTFEGANGAPAWTPDGQVVAFVSVRGGERDLYAKPADGSGMAQVLLDEERPIGGAVYSRDGQWLVYRVGAGGGRDIFAMRLDGNSSSVELIASQFEERSPALSPDGKWLAYVSNEQGRSEVFVRPFPDAGAVKWQVSTVGGWEPLWANNGRELFYRSSADEFVAVEVEVEPSFAVRRQRTLFSTEDYLSNVDNRAYDVSPDDQRFVMVQFVGETAVTGEMIVVENFFEELREE